MNSQNNADNRFFHPVWIFFTITIPQVVLFLLFARSFQIIKSLLKDEQLLIWRNFGLALGMLILFFTVYGIILFLKRQKVHTIISLFIFIFYVSLIYLYGQYVDDMFPPRLPFWMISYPDLGFYYPGTFFMMAFIYALLILVFRLTPREQQSNPGISFLCAVLIPLFWYGFYRIILPHHRFFNHDYIDHVICVLFISMTIVFIFFLLRGVYILQSKQSGRLKKINLPYRIVITLLFPLLGLSIYQGFFTFSGQHVFKVFGDFSHPLFFILAGLNGVALIVPHGDSRRVYLSLFLLRCFTFPFTVYFLLVFLPFFPLSIVAILAAGIGFLMLTPLLLMLVHSKILIEDLKTLSTQFSKKQIIMAALLMISLLPGGITFKLYLDRTALHQALNYIDHPTFSEEKSKNISLINLRNALDTVTSFSDESSFFEHRVPFITPYYQWLVLDNMTISNRKIETLERIFFGKDSDWRNLPASISESPDVVVSHIESSTKFNTKTRTYHSYIHLDLENKSSGRLAEFATSIQLPAGVWVSDYYLWVDGKKVHGRLVEKKSALWIYQQIRQTRRDPGIVYYLHDNLLALRVYPFNGNEVRKTGLELIHKVPITLSIKDKLVKLDDNAAKSWNKFRQTGPIVSTNGNAAFFPASYIANLPKIQREPYYHFILDFSSGTKQAQKDYAKKIKALLNISYYSSNKARITLSNYRSKTFDWSDNWEQEINTFPVKGGFFLEHAIKSILIRNFEEKHEFYPVIVVISPDFYNAVFSQKLDDLSFTYPERDTFFQLTPDGSFKTHSLYSYPALKSKNEAQHTVRAWPDLKNPTVFVRDNHRSTTVLIPQGSEQLLISKNPDDKWLEGLSMWAKWKTLLLNPSKTDTGWVELVRQSKKANILHPYTSFTVLENQAQWEVLKRKEKTALAGNKSMDMSKNPEKMPEPSVILIIVCLVALWWVFIKNKRDNGIDRIKTSC